MLTKADAREFEQILNVLFVETYGRAPMSRDGLRLWWGAVSRYDMAEIRRALSAHVMNADVGQYPPKPADIIKNLEGTGEGRAFEAWNKLLAAIQRVGTYRDVVFDDPIIHAVVVDMGGWIQFGKMLIDEIPFRSAEFVKRYRSYIIMPPKAYLPRLGGISSAENSTKGHPSQPPVLIGDEARCALVHEGGTNCTVQITHVKSAGDIAMLALGLNKPKEIEHAGEANRGTQLAAAGQGD